MLCPLTIQASNKSKDVLFLLAIQFKWPSFDKYQPKLNFIFCAVQFKLRFSAANVPIFDRPIQTRQLEATESSLRAFKEKLRKKMRASSSLNNLPLAQHEVS